MLKKIQKSLKYNLTEMDDTKILRKKILDLLEQKKREIQFEELKPMTSSTTQRNQQVGR